MNDRQTIYALSSAQGRAGVSVIRISGAGTARTVRNMAGDLPDARLASLRPLRRYSDGALIDHALVLWFPGPASFTGEDAAEFHVHGGPAVIAATLNALGEFDGLRIAEPGEFSRRAFDNGKLDLVQAEALSDLIEAETEAQHRQAVNQAAGALSDLYNIYRDALIEAMSLLEAEIDFSDEEDVPEQLAENVTSRVRALRDEIAGHLDDGHRGEILRDGFRVVLAGPPNAGKSSLLNALARRPAAIVSNEPGTTRDVIEVRLDLTGIPVMVSDTAGIREVSGVVEQEGINRSFEAARQADLVIWLRDITEAGNAKYGDVKRLEVSPDRMLKVANKIDLLDAKTTADADNQTEIGISALTGVGIDRLTDRIAKIAAERIGDHEAPVLTRSRHRQLLERALEALDSFLTGDLAALELRAEDLRSAAHALGRITGRVDVEDLLDRIFASFCIGK